MRYKHSIAVATFSCLIVFISCSSAASEAEVSCELVRSVPLNETLQMEGIKSDEFDLFAIEVPVPGLLLLDVAVPGSSNTVPIITIREGRCGIPREQPQSIRLVQSLVHGLLVEVRSPGSYLLHVDAVDTTQILESYRLGIWFLELAGLDWALRDGEGSSRNSEDGEIDVDESENELISRQSAEVLGLSYWVSWCDFTAGSDDHGDSPFCASWVLLGVPIAGELQNLSYSDYDVFAFSLSATTVVHIESTGPTDTFGVLYDRFGNRLAIADEGGKEGNFRLVQRLGPGMYFVRVEGADDSQGEYGLEIVDDRRGFGGGGAG